MEKQIKIASLQFSVSNDIEENCDKIENAIIDSHKQNARVLLTQECALTGYPPVEIESVKQIDFSNLEKCLIKLSKLCVENDIYLFLGYVKTENDKYYNVVECITPNNGDNIIYYKRALWGWDKSTFSTKESEGIIEIDNFKFGVRICFEIRFPEYFRELYKKDIEICVMSFSHVEDNPNNIKSQIIQSQIVSRAVENSMFIITANSCTKNQIVKTNIIDPCGNVICELAQNEPGLLIALINKTEPDFGRKGTIEYSNILTGKNKEL